MLWAVLAFDEPGGDFEQEFRARQGKISAFGGTSNFFRIWEGATKVESAKTNATAALFAGDSSSVGQLTLTARQCMAVIPTTTCPRFSLTRGRAEATRWAEASRPAFSPYQNRIKNLSETSAEFVRRAKSRFPRLLERLRNDETEWSFWKG